MQYRLQLFHKSLLKMISISFITDFTSNIMQDMLVAFTQTLPWDVIPVLVAYNGMCPWLPVHY